MTQQIYIVLKIKFNNNAYVCSCEIRRFENLIGHAHYVNTMSSIITMYCFVMIYDRLQVDSLGQHDVTNSSYYTLPIGIHGSLDNVSHVYIL